MKHVLSVKLTGLRIFFDVIGNLVQFYIPVLDEYFVSIFTSNLSDILKGGKRYFAH